MEGGHREEEAVAVGQSRDPGLVYCLPLDQVRYHLEAGLVATLMALVLVDYLMRLE